MDHYAEAERLIDMYGTNYGRANYPDMINAHATMAVADLLKQAQRPVEIRLDAMDLGTATVPERDRSFVPGDMVGMTIKSLYHTHYNGRHGVVTYGPDTAGGWVVTSATGDLRCGPEELTMITRREDRTWETDAKAAGWKK